MRSIAMCSGSHLQILAERLTRWLQAQTRELPRTLSFDGKIIRDKLGLSVTLIDTEEGTPVAAKIQGQGHELITTQALLPSPAVNLVNATGTADSSHCQDQTAHIAVRAKDDQFLFRLRDNQPMLHQLAQSRFVDKAPLFLQPTATLVAPSSANSAG